VELFEISPMHKDKLVYVSKTISISSDLLVRPSGGVTVFSHTPDFTHLSLPLALFPLLSLPTATHLLTIN